MAYDFTSKTGTNGGTPWYWSQAASWVGGVAPVGSAAYGKSILIAGHVTIDTANVSSIGAAGAGNGVARIDINSSTAILDNTTDGPLAITWNSSGGIGGANAVGTTTGPDGGAVGWAHPGADATCKGLNVGHGTLTLIGTSAHPITITTADGASPWYLLSGWGTLGVYSGCSITLKYVNSYNQGYADSAGGYFSGIYFLGYGSTPGIDIENCQFFSPYCVVWYPSGGSSSGPVTALNNTISSPRGPMSIQTWAAAATGPHVVSGNTWLPWAPSVAHTCIKLYGANSPVASDNVATTSGGIGCTLVATYSTTGATLARNFLLQPATGTAGITIQHTPTCQGTTITDCLGVGTNNVVFAAGPSGQGTTCTGLYARGWNPATLGQGYLAIGPSGSHTFANCIFVSGDGAATPDEFGFMPYGGAVFNVTHCTFVTPVTSPCGVIGVLVSDGGSSPCSGLVVKACLFVGGPAASAITDQYAGATVQYASDYDGVGVHHNAVYGITYTGTGTSHSGQGSTGYTDGTNLHPNAVYGDVTLGSPPGFVDTTRTELTWDATMPGGLGTIASIAAQFGNRCGLTGTTYNPNYTVAALKAYLFAGYTPTNAAADNILPGDSNAVKTAGAVAYSSGLTPALTVSPTSGSAIDASTTLSITPTLANSSASLTAAVTGAGTLSTSAPTSGSAFTFTPPTSGSGTATVTVTDATDSLTATCTVTYAPAGLVAGTISASTFTIGLTAGAASGGTGTIYYQWYGSTVSGFTPGSGNLLSGQISQNLAGFVATAGNTYYFVRIATDSATPTAATAATAQYTVSALVGGTVPSANDVRYGTAVGVTTGLLVVPGAQYVLNSQTFDYNATPGTLTLPTAAQVISTVTAYGVAGTGSAGTVVQPSIANVRHGTAYGPSSGLSGTCYVPTASQVLTTINVDATTGNVVLPTAGQVETGVTFGPSGGTTGTLATGGTVPSAADVLLGVAVGSTTGTLTLPTASQVLSTVTAYGAGGTALAGNVVLPTAGQVETGVTFGPSGGTTGTLATGGGSDPWATALPGSYAAGTAGAILGEMASWTSVDEVPASLADKTGFSLSASQAFSTTGAVGSVAAPVAVADKTGFSLSPGGLDAVPVEIGVNARQALSPILAASAGVLLGAGTGTITIRGGSSAITRVVASTDNAGNRTAVTLTLPT